ncbi:MAG TPA: response regulator transcription factor [Myxococcota bacterium]|nr:response regulator transcription factor [Myxococcota bacterium]
MIRVLVADDHPIVRHGICQLIDLEPDMRVIDQAVDGSELVEKLGQASCDVLVLDLSLPHIRGLELLHLIKERWPKLTVLIFTVQPEDTFALYMLEAGAAGYLCKDRGVDAVLSAIRTVARGQRYLSPRLAELALDHGAQPGTPHERFSSRERQVFDRLIQGMSVTAIAAELEISASTTSNHLARIREKLGVENNGEVMIYAARARLI